MNRQEAFNIAAEHLLAQGSQSRLDKPDNNGKYPCAYRGEGGAKCAIGALIPDDQYDTRFEGTIVTSLLQQGSCPAILKSEELGKDFLQDLQNVHDESALADASDFRMRLGWFAIYWKLDSTVLEKIQ